MRALGIALLVLAGARTAAAASFAIAVGYNGSSRQEVAPLAYADDDAVRNAELLGELGVPTTLLTALDGDTRALYPDLAPRAPTLSELRSALATTTAQLAQARAAGEPTALLFFYTGHGDVEHGEGFLELLDARLTRTELRSLLRTVPVDQVHLIIDACKSYFAVFDRGGSSRRAVADPFLRPEEPLPANVGVLLSTSSSQDSHEWEAFQGGIFSHEVRSALRGGADLDGDGAISYEEVGAFVFTANRSIPNARFRPDFFVRPPGGKPASTLLVQVGAVGPASELSVGPGVSEHLYIEDERGLRMADVHPSPDLTVHIVLPERRPLFVHALGSAQEYAIAEPGNVTLASLTARPPESRSRGALHVAFSHLFAEPFDASAPAAFDAAMLVRAEEARLAALPPPMGRWLRPTLGVAGLVFAAAGAGASGLAFYERAQVSPSSSNRSRLAHNAAIARYNQLAVPLYGLAATTLVSYVLWRYVGEDDRGP
ncbi:MAG: caspase family protein [Myxococcota bacterium]